VYKFGGDPTICLGEVMVSANSVHRVHCGQTDCNTSLPRAGEVIKQYIDRCRRENDTEKN